VTHHQFDSTGDVESDLFSFPFFDVHDHLSSVDDATDSPKNLSGEDELDDSAPIHLEFHLEMQLLIQSCPNSAHA
jgi:hypothetical protein